MSKSNRTYSDKCASKKEAPKPDVKEPDLKKPGIFKRIGTFFKNFGTKHPKVTKVLKVTGKLVEVSVLGALAAKFALDLFGKKSYIDVPLQIPEDPENLIGESAHQLLEDHKGADVIEEVENVLQSVPDMEVVKF